MTEPGKLADRLDEVETTLAHHLRSFDDLEQVVRDQWKRIDELTRRVAGLTDQLREAETRLRQVGPPEPPPPHY